MKVFLIVGAFYGLTSVILGAFGAHALKDQLTADRLASFETGVRYQMVHAVLLLVIALLAGQGNTAALRWSGCLVTAGVLLFSGSIYLLATRDLIGLSTYRWLGPVTPLGGLCMIAGWLLLLVHAVRLKG